MATGSTEAFKLRVLIKLVGGETKQRITALGPLYIVDIARDWLILLLFGHAFCFLGHQRSDSQVVQKATGCDLLLQLHFYFIAAELEQ